MLAKAKKLTQKRKAEAWKALEAAQEAGDKEAEAEARDEIRAAEAEEESIEQQEEELEQEGEPAEAPEPDPCSLPCECDIRCEPGELCKCTRHPVHDGGLPPDGVDPKPPEGGGGGAKDVPAPDVKVPEGVTGEPEPKGDGGEDGEEDKEKEPPPNGGKGRGPNMPPGVRTGVFRGAPPGGALVLTPPGAIPLWSGGSERRSVVSDGTEIAGWVGGETGTGRPPWCKDCRSAMRQIAIRGSQMTDEEAAECLWAALGGWSGFDSPFQAALVLGSGFRFEGSAEETIPRLARGEEPDLRELSSGYAELRRLLTQACRGSDPLADPAWLLSPDGRDYWGVVAEPPQGFLGRYVDAALSIADDFLDFLAQLIGAAFGLGLKGGMFFAAWISGESKPTAEELFEPLLDLIAKTDFTDLSPFQRWAVNKLAALLEGIQRPVGTFKDIGVGVIESPAALAKMMKDALNGDEKAQFGLLIFAATFRPGRTIATARRIVGVVKSISRKAALALRRLRGVTLEDITAALRRKGVRRGSTTEYATDKVRVHVDDGGNVTDIEPGKGPPTGEPVQPPGSAPDPSPPPSGKRSPLPRPPRDVLMPDGKPIGTRGSSSAIREVPGGVREARQMFDELAAGGRDVTPPGHPGKLVELPGGGRVGFRPSSKSGPPTVDVKISDVPIKKVKFIE